MDILGAQHFSRGYEGNMIGVEKSSPSRSAYNGTVQRPARCCDASSIYNIGDASTVDVLDPNVSLVDKLKYAYQNRHDKHDLKSRHFFRFLFQFQIITQLYMTLTYCIPYLFSDYDDMTQYWLKVLACYVFAMGEANWLCSILYSNKLPDPRDRPALDDSDWFETSALPETLNQNFQNREEAAQQIYTRTDKNGLKWKMCHKCQRYKPPRTHHCNICRTCVLRRDHHCYLIGTCIGHYNQRYFVAFCFLGMFAAGIGFPLTVASLRSMADGAFWLDYVFPWAFIRMLLGQVSWQFCLLTFHAVMLLVFGIMCVIYGWGQMIIVALGLTLYEVAKKVPVKVTSSAAENMRIVFGDYWAVNFLFPGQILFKQRHDGIHWDTIKMTSNPGETSTSTGDANAKAD